ncbi:hypothetical protein [Membranihabitans maritimus]|uniref:hypothetical protein n=1 Tax=Membranihabitans maritimus TaxID=2904244 RepID=UPI001F2AFBC6|nr:hypothetical protein [Membranihabitans maritimus]
MKVQVIFNNEGKKAGVYIPIDEWEILKKEYKNLEDLEYEEVSKEQLLGELRQAVGEIEQIEKGSLEARPVKELLDEI